MSLRVWDERVLPRLTDRSLRGPELDELRGAVCAGLTGRVLEIGFGSSIRREWEWRVKRGESLRNLEAFAAFADPSGRGPASDDGPG